MLLIVWAGLVVAVIVFLVVIRVWHDDYGEIDD
jgi:hypothetical protein